MPVLIDYLAITPPRYLTVPTIFLCTPVQATLSLVSGHDGLTISRQTSTLMDVN